MVYNKMELFFCHDCLTQEAQIYDQWFYQS